MQNRKTLTSVLWLTRYGILEKLPVVENEKELRRRDQRRVKFRIEKEAPKRRNLLKTKTRNTVPRKKQIWKKKKRLIRLKRKRTPKRKKKQAQRRQKTERRRKMSKMSDLPLPRRSQGTMSKEKNRQKNRSKRRQKPLLQLICQWR